MLSRTAAFLEINYPSSTTISYTISSRKKPTSVLLYSIPHFIRFLGVVYFIVTGLAKARQNFGIDAQNEFVEQLLAANMFQFAAQRLDWWMLAIITVLGMYMSLTRHYTEESLLVLQGLGVQTSTSAPYYFMAPTTTFIPTTEIQDIVIHEAFKGLGVRFYLAIIVKNAPEVVVVFPNLLPRRHVLEEVWRGARKCLYAR